MFTLKRHLQRALDIYSDVLQHPSFPDSEFQRERKIALGLLVQLRDDPATLANMAVNTVLYTSEHPYGRPVEGTPRSLKSLRREDLEAFYRVCFRPEDAALIVVGDVTADQMVRELEGVFGQWRPVPTEFPATALPAPPPPQPSRIILVHKPGAVQSVISVALIGAERNSPDYFAILVMNTIFGGQFSSRLNMNLRESKGYTYGARSGFGWRVRQPGPFVASASVQTAVTAAALVEMLEEMAGMVGRRPVTPEELAFSKDYLTRGYPATFETPRDVAAQLETIVQHRLPDDYFNTVVPKIQAVTIEDVLRVAKKHLDLDHLAVVIVGDRAQIETSLRELCIGKNLAVVRFDEDFRLVPAGE